MRRTTAAIATLALTVAAAAVAHADDDTTSLSYISYLERYATVQPAGDAEALEAQINMPVLSGDRVETSRGARVEIQLADGSTLWVDEFTTIDFDALAFSRDDPAERTALYLSGGSVAFEIPATALGDGTVRFDTPSGVVFLHRPGLYRLDLDGDRLHADTFEGLAELPEGMGSALLRPGEQAWVGGDGVQTAALDAGTDDFWGWVQDRRHPQASGQTAQYVGANDASRAAILDSYGDWVYVPSFSTWMWRPRVSVGWVPYSYGRWYWTSVGWNWISYEPWGWYPFHYGSWYFDASIGWTWCWDWVWGPAWVHWIYTPGYVGWCPRGYYDWWYARNYYPHAGRWARTALDFSGRVRLRSIDPRPWTMVPADRFDSAHIDRMRVDARHVLRDMPGEREGYVRSGPLLTRSRTGTAAETLFAGDYRTTTRVVPALDTLLGRGGGNPAAGVLPIRRSETVDFARTPVRSPDERIAPRERPATLVERSSAVRSPAGAISRPPTVQQPSGARIDRGRSSPGGRAVPQRSLPAAPPATSSRPSSRPPTSRGKSTSPPAGRPSSPPPNQARPPAQKVSPPARSGGTSSRTPGKPAAAPKPSDPGSGRAPASRGSRTEVSLSRRLLSLRDGQRPSAQYAPRSRAAVGSRAYGAPSAQAPRNGATPYRPGVTRPRAAPTAPRAYRQPAPQALSRSTARPTARTAPRASAPSRSSTGSRSSATNRSSARSRPSSGGSHSSTSRPHHRH